MSNHAVIDLETTSANPHQGRILTIGVVVGDPADGEERESLHIGVREDAIYNSNVQDDPETMDWWMLSVGDASADGRMAERIAFDHHGLDSFHVEDALHRLNEFLVETGTKYVWGNGPNFDLSFLERYYNLLKIEPAYKYYNVRCMRTIIHAAGINKKDDKYKAGIDHVAVDDARREFRQLSDAWQKLKGGK